MCILWQIYAQNDYLKPVLRKISWVLKYSFHFCELGFGPSRPPFGSNEVSLESRGTWHQTQVFAHIYTHTHMHTHMYTHTHAYTHTHTYIYIYIYLFIFIFMYLYFYEFSLVFTCLEFLCSEPIKLKLVMRCVSNDILFLSIRCHLVTI